MDDETGITLILAALSSGELMTASQASGACRQLSVTDISRLLEQMKRLGYVASGRDPLRYAITPEGRKRLKG